MTWQILSSPDERPPLIGSEVVVERPRDVSWLPALRMYVSLGSEGRQLTEKWGHRMEFVPDYKAWYTFEGGPILTTILSEYDNTWQKKQHELVWQDNVVLAELVRIEEYQAVFKVRSSAPKELIKTFHKFMLKFNGRFTSQEQWPKAIHAASRWFHDRYTSFGLSRSGHSIRFVYTGENEQLDQLFAWSEELYEKLPSGSGFDNGWVLEFYAKHIEATTEYSPMNGETGQYEEDIELRYDLRQFGMKWEMQDLNADLDDPEGHYEYCGDTLWEALNDA